MSLKNKTDRESSGSACPSCGLDMGPAFCAYCGEQRLHAGNRSIKHLFTQYIEQITSVDSKIWRTLKVLLVSPGQLG